MNKIVIRNFYKIQFSIVFFPITMLLLILFFFWSRNALTIEKSFEIQKTFFLFLNHKIREYPNILSDNALYNFTQFGDAFTFLSLLTIFIVYAPKLWEGLISSSIISLILCSSLKNFFKYPRPAAILDNHCFNIVGKVLSGHNSLPSGHSTTVLAILTIILFGFMPKKTANKIFWTSSILIIGLFLASTRIFIGAHFPLDVVVGSIIGYISGVTGILLNEKYQISKFLNNTKYYPVIILILLISIIITFMKIINQSLVIYYFSFISLIISLFTILKHYVKNKSKASYFCNNNKYP